MDGGAAGTLQSPKCMCIDVFVPRKREFLLDVENSQISITHQFKLMNLISDADSFLIELPDEIKQDPSKFEKLVLTSFACAFTLDLSYYESSGNQNRGMYGAYVQ
jgi:hypothetical protein